jgi:hypothetical protein
VGIQLESLPESSGRSTQIFRHCAFGLSNSSKPSQ